VPRDGKLVMAARGGFAARGLLYGVIGFLALQGQAKDPNGALGWVSRHYGSPILIPLGLGFAAYALWRLLNAACDADDHGSDTKGVLVRIGGAGIGFIYLGFALATARLAFFPRSDNGPSAADRGAATAMDLPGGPMLLYAAAAAFLAAGIWQFTRAWKLKFLKRITAQAASSPLVKWIGRIGLLARGSVFVTVAWLFLQAANHLRASEAGGSGEALGTMPPTIRAAIGVGLMLFGLFSLVEAWFRAIGDPHVGRRVMRALA
jgi:hypothetical protein